MGYYQNVDNATPRVFNIEMFYSYSIVYVYTYVYIIVVDPGTRTITSVFQQGLDIHHNIIIIVRFSNRTRTKMIGIGLIIYHTQRQYQYLNY